MDMASLNAEQRFRNFRPYPEYKESGVEWLGVIPIHWEIRRLKYIAQFSNRVISVKSNDLPYLALEHVEPWTGRVLQNDQLEDPETAVVPFSKGDVLFGKLRPYLAKVVLAQFDGVCSSEFVVMRPGARCNNRYLFYCMINPSLIRFVTALTYGTKMPRVSPGHLGDLPIPLPPLAEQNVIAAFLDRETAKIDALVAKKERLIELLREKRSTLIVQAVTKGLNPTVPMKDSGVEWLGEVPAHWEVGRLRSTVAAKLAGVWGEEPDGRNDVPCVRVVDFDRVTLRVTIDRPTLRSVDPQTLHARCLRAGDLLLEKSGGGEQQPVGAVVLYDHEVMAVCSNFIDVLRPAEGFSPRYLSYLHASLYISKVNTRSIKQSIGIQNLDVQSYLNELVPLPPPSEQRAIAAFLDSETSKINTLIAKIGEGIERLKEYRTALVSAAVTGKIDVRDEVCHGDRV